jgi:hypothetical protein
VRQFFLPLLYSLLQNKKVIRKPAPQRVDSWEDGVNFCLRSKRETGTVFRERTSTFVCRRTVVVLRSRYVHRQHAKERFLQPGAKSQHFGTQSLHDPTQSTQITSSRMRNLEAVIVAYSVISCFFSLVVDWDDIVLSSHDERKPDAHHSVHVRGRLLHERRLFVWFPAWW